MKCSGVDLRSEAECRGHALARTISGNLNQNPYATGSVEQADWTRGFKAGKDAVALEFELWKQSQAKEIKMSVEFSNEEVVEALIWNGWEVKRCGWDSTVFQWRSPRGISGSEWVSKHLYTIPMPVLADAKHYSELTKT